MIPFEEGKARFVYRLAGIALHSDQVLLHVMIHVNFWSVPGGRGELLEPSPETLRREMRDELGMNV